MNSNIKFVGKREDGTLILGVGDLDHHEHFDHYEDLEKCDRCGETDLTFDPKLGNECDTCGYKEWEK